MLEIFTLVLVSVKNNCKPFTGFEYFVSKQILLLEMREWKSTKENMCSLKIYEP